MSFIVAIDGPAGSGKGTITKILAEKLGLVCVDTGAMYRCITLYMLRNNINMEETDKIKSMLEHINIEFKKDNNQDIVLLDGENVTKQIREKDVNNLVSQVSHIPEVRENVTNLLRKFSIGKEIIMEGRDIGTNVFPNANVKIYLDATPEERANRRLKQNQEKGIDIPFDEILNNIIFRDNNDKTSNIAPLKQAEDAILIDSTNMEILEVVEEIEKIIKDKMNQGV